MLLALGMKKKTGFDLRQNITDTIVESLENDTAPWVQSWDGTGGYPRNGDSGRLYSGINVLLLTIAGMDYNSNEWFTRNAIKKADATWSGKGTTVVYFQMVRRSDPKKRIDPKTGQIAKMMFPFMKYFRVWNRDQCVGLPEQKVTDVSEFDRNANAEQFIKDTGAEIRYGKDRAFYAPSRDIINLPDAGAFTDSGSFYATSLHELGHWTGHKTRLDRKLGNGFGSEGYAEEELVAELTAAFLCAELGIDGELQHPEYIASWIKVLKNDKQAIFKASSKATKAATFLHNCKSKKVKGLEVVAA